MSKCHPPQKKVVNSSNVDLRESFKLLPIDTYTGNKKSNFSTLIMQQRPPTYLVTYWILCLTCYKVKKRRETEKDKLLFFYLLSFSHIFNGHTGLILHILQEFCMRKLTFEDLSRVIAWWSSAWNYLQSWHSCILSSLIKSFHTTIFHRYK